MVLKPKPILKIVSQYTTINFDDVPDGTAIDTHYQNLGVTFQSVTDQPHNQWSAFARQSGNAQSQKNVVSVNQTGEAGFDGNEGGVLATFVKPQRYVCINVRPVIDTGAENNTDQLGTPYIQSFDPSGAYMDTYYYPLAFGQPGWGDYRPLFLQSATTTIGMARFSVHPSAYKNAPIYGYFDNLVFTNLPPPPIKILLGPGG